MPSVRQLGLVAVGTFAAAQQIGKNKADEHLSMSLGQCTVAGGCTSTPVGVTLDGNWRWLHKVGTSTNCYTGDEWDATICPDDVTCTENCALDGVPTADWSGTYGVGVSENTLQLNFVTQGPYSKNVGSRTYMTTAAGDKYQMFKLKNKEFSFDVDVSNLPCGLNGALYFVEMPEDGGMSVGNNKAGARYGTGYCDAQCPHDMKFIQGKANSEGWKPSPTDVNAGTGKYGSCCAEMDIWEANSQATAYTPHVCNITGSIACTGTECGDNDAGDRFKGVCDKDGCDFNSYRLGNTTFFGAGSSFSIDTTQPFQVITQFITSDGTDSGDLSEIRRLYVQNGKTVQNSPVSVGGKTFDSVSDSFCAAQKDAFGDPNQFAAKGGMKAMGDVLERGVVLVMSMWDDHSVDMLWLDSDYPPNKPAGSPGVSRGPCATTSGDPTEVEKDHPNSSVKYGNIKVGEIGSTGGGPSPPPAPPTPPVAPTPTPSGCPGGSLDKCIALCPSDPAAAYKACVDSCVQRCS